MKKHPVYDHLNRKKPSILALIDPDRVLLENACKIAEFVIDQGVDGIMVGSSLLVSSHFEHFIAQIKKGSSKPVIIFPGCSHQIAKKADAIFFLSLLSGRNSEFLIGEQVKAVFCIKEIGLEVIPVGYILIDSGSYTTVEYISNTRPIPRNKPEVAVAHALTGEYFGMKYTYLEAGSGARMPVPVDMIKKVKKETSISLIVGGGIKTAKTARAIIDAGADIIVLGSIIEKSKSEFKKIMRATK
ncbi:hypothetical protein A2Y85_06830 [candidate division WOR-3 bacterium RBG_13_43_14]|uniref:Phosphoglycerol geranylgeranyltransferase n=1 Tax=candidate division WOR-3 bacterium RBG_13_43_14 TaxID=1802590 RepID=A0A1F4UDQ3_UNCW3|nr:MAG: hypothetical protein A2Y85_06830 [candidate division WOR-3 bacterium RBG_13_43_14]